MFGHEPLHGVAAQGPAGSVGEQRLVGVAVSFFEPNAKHGNGLTGQWGDAVFAAFAVAAHVWAGVEVDVLHFQSGQFGDPQPGLGGEEEKGVVSAAERCGPVRCGQQGRGLIVVQVSNDGAVAAFRGDRQDSFDQGGMFGGVQGGVPEQCPDRGQPRISGGDTVVALGFQVGQERADHRGVQIGQVKIGGLLAQGPGGEAEEQFDGVPVGGDGVRADLALPDQPVGEEALQQGGQRVHRVTTVLFSRRDAARANSSGVACRYQ